MTFDTIPFKFFLRLLKKGDAVVHRCIRMGKIDMPQRNWTKIKEQWESANDDGTGSIELELKKKIFSETININKVILLKEWIKRRKAKKEFFDAIGLNWSDNDSTNIEALDKLLEKAENKLAIYNAQFSEIKKEDDDAEDEDKAQELNEDRAIASLELHGFNVPDYNKLSLSKYCAMAAIIRKKKDNNGRPDKG